jgi:Tfp pilus assembly protein PilN
VIRGNLSTRPFYNERAVRLALLAVALLVVAATLFNVTEALRLSRRDSALQLQARQDEDQARELRATAAHLRETIDPGRIQRASEDAKLANALIDRRMFSWTDLFNRFEDTLPDDVRITAVRPGLDPARGIVLTIDVVARSVEDVDRFMERLDATGAFRELLSTNESFDKDGQLESTLQAVYRPPAADPGAPKQEARR